MPIMQLYTLRIAVMLSVIAILTSQACAQSDSTSNSIPHFTSHVYDTTETLTPKERTELDSMLWDYEDSTSTQIVVAIIPTTHGELVHDLAVRTANENRLGQRDKNNGILILLAKEDRTGFIATGLGIERIIPDSVLARIWEDIMVAGLKRGQYYDAISATILALESKLVGHFNADPALKRK